MNRIARIGLLTSIIGCGSGGGNSSPSPPPSGANLKAYVGLFGDKAVAVLDTKTQQVLTTIPVTSPDGLVITPDGTKVYVSSVDTGTVDVIDTKTNTILKSISVGTQPQGLSVTPDGTRVVGAVQGDGKAVLIDTATDTVVAQVTIGKPHSCGIGPDGKSAYVASQSAPTPAVVTLDLGSDAVTTTLSVDKAPRAIGVAPWGKVYFSVIGSDGLEAIDVASGQLIAPIPTGGSPHDTRPTLDGKMELVVSQTAGDLELIDPSTDAVTDKIPTGKMPHWIALSGDGQFAYVTNEGDDNVAVVDLGKRAVVSTIPIGHGPRKIAIQR